ncbi:MAG: efflux RND transporter periplasmic adaptor subunit [Armatimonadetes bacterium]|nr:efflux RND transporter periplasmic adaptor subunit [Armatimonadota bacterium]
MKMDYRQSGLFSAALVGLIALSSCSKPNASPAKETGAEATAIAVGVEKISAGNLEQTVDVTGNLIATQDVIVSPKIGGKIERLLVREGDKVSRGQVIAIQDTSDLSAQLAQAQAAVRAAEARLAQANTQARIEPAMAESQIQTSRAAVLAAKARLDALKAGARPQEREQAQSAVNSAKAQLDWAQTDYDSTKQLVDAGALGRTALIAKKSALDGAQANYQNALKALSLVQEGPRQEDIDAAAQQLRQAEEAYNQSVTGRASVQLRNDEAAAARATVAQAEANLRYARQQLDNAYVKAPFDGVVADKLLEAGAMAAAGTPVVRLVTPGRLFLEATVSETLVQQVRAGQMVRVEVDALPGKEFDARVDKIYPAADHAGRSFKARIALSNATAELRPGMFARGRIVVREFRNVPLTPRSAIVETAGDVRTYIVRNGKAVERKVRIVYASSDRVYAEGMQVGESVITRGVDLMSNGVPVNIVGGQE